MKQFLVLGTLFLCGFTMVGCQPSKDGKQNGQAVAILPLQGKITFTSTRNGGKKQVFIMNADRSNQTPLTTLGENWKPALSPDGTKIAFVSDRDGNTEIYLMNSDGSNQQNLSKNPAKDEDPCFSPEGQRIAFHSNREKTLFQVYAMDMTGNTLRRRTNISTDNYGPAWGPGDPTSADPRRMLIAFHQASSGQIWVMYEDGGNPRPLQVQGVTKLANASWSPDGSRITFWGVKDGKSNIFVMNADGNGLAQVTEGISIQRDPSWSSDGKRIVFVSNAAGTFDIWSVDAKARLVKLEMEAPRATNDELVQLTDDPGADMHPSCGR